MGHWIVPLEPLQAAFMRLDFFVAGGIASAYKHAKAV